MNADKEEDFDTEIAEGTEKKDGFPSPIQSRTSLRGNDGGKRSKVRSQRREKARMNANKFAPTGNGPLARVKG